MLCIWYPFEWDMALDGTLTSHIERVADEFDMACRSAIYPISHENGYHMHILAQNNFKYKFHNKETHNGNITTSTANHGVRYGVRSELCITLKHSRGVRELYLIFREYESIR